MHPGVLATAKRALALVISLTLAFAAFEGLLRSQIIAIGHHRHLEKQGEIEAPRRKLLILGDSFFDRRTELNDLLVQRLAPRKFEVLNLASSGMGPVEYLWELQAYGAAFDPDVVLLSYYIGNDLTDVQYKLPALLAQDSGIKAQMRPIIRRFQTYHFFKEKREALRIRRFDAERIRAHGIDEKWIELASQHLMNPSLLELAIQHPHYLLDNVLMDSDASAQAWMTIEQTLDRIHALCKNIGADLKIAIFPRSIQIDDSHFAFFSSLGFELDERTLTSARPQTLLGQYCRRRDLSCLDLLPAFRARSGEDLYRIHDDHLNEAGNEAAARWIAGWIGD